MASIVNQPPARTAEPYLAIRRLTDRAATLLLGLCTALTVAVLVFILGYIVARGATYLNWGFLTSMPAPAGEPGGGIANALIGSLIIVGLAALMAIPIGMGAAIFANEYRSRRLAVLVRFLADLLTGVPSIVVGLAVLALVVLPMGGFSGFSGALAYAFIMIPIVLISAQEALRIVPNGLREAAMALGIPRWRMILAVVMPTASRALATGVALAIARALGETAPLLFTAFGNAFWNVDPTKPMAAVPLVIYRYAVGPYDDWHAQAWAASFVVVMVVLVASLLTRLSLRSGQHE
jgi:phosphate transport system permease protein